MELESLSYVHIAGNQKVDELSKKDVVNRESMLFQFTIYIFTKTSRYAQRVIKVIMTETVNVMMARIQTTL